MIFPEIDIDDYLNVDHILSGGLKLSGELLEHMTGTENSKSKENYVNQIEKDILEIEKLLNDAKNIAYNAAPDIVLNLLQILDKVNQEINKN